MKKQLFLCALCCIFTTVFVGQETFSPTTVKTGTFLGKTEPLRDFATLENDAFGETELRIVPNLYEGIVLDEEQYVNRSEASRQYEQGTFQNSEIGVDFEGSSSAESGFIPPDPTGAVGPNHYLHSVNSLVKIFDKEGNLLTGPTSLGAFIGNGDNFGDPIALYDQLADRFFISQFGSSNNSLVLAVSETPDPTGAYNVYEFIFDAFPDYPHYSVWPDGYYLTVNEGGGGGGANPREAYVIERDVILAGGINPQIAGFVMEGQFSNPTTIHSGEPANLLGTSFPEDTPGFITYLQDDSWSGTITFDHLKVWEIDIDWDNIDSSTISAPQEIPVDSFDSLFAPFGVGEINQPGTGQELAGQGGIISYAANYRSFDDHNSWVITFNVDIDGNDTSGIRWIELRNTAADPTWSVFQEGTYAPEDGLSRFMSSSAMDAQGNIGLAFNIAGNDLPVGIRHTGRFTDDPLGMMTVEEVNILDASGVQTNSNRFGDYSHTTMDPDNFTFWHTTQYFPSNNFWASRVTSYSLSPGFDIDAGTNEISSPSDGVLSNMTEVDVVVRNFSTQEQANIPVQLSVDGVVVANEVVPGPIAAGEFVMFTFGQSVDLSIEGQTYELSVRTDLAGDQFASNDEVTKTVKHIFGTDVGVSQIVSPESGESLSDAEEVTIAVTNFGATEQSNINVSYTLDGVTSNDEVLPGPIASLETMSYTFSQTVDLSVIQTYTISSTTSLEGDADAENDGITNDIENNFCMPEANCAGFDDGVTQFQLVNQDLITNCGGATPGYSDDTDIVFDFVLNENPFEGTLQVGFAASTFAIWIDFNDNLIFEAEELIVDDFVAQANTDFNFTVDLSTIPALTTGTHLMRLRGEDDDQDGDLLNPCDILEFGRTNDYTANITGTLGLADASSSRNIQVITLQDNNFDIQLNTPSEDRIYIGVYNMLGQQLKYKEVARRDEGYGLNLDMSQMASGVYLVRLGTSNAQRYDTAKIIVR